MFETVITVLFVFLLLGVVAMALRLGQGLTKVGILVTLALVLPVLVKGFLAASGSFLLMPLGLLMMTFGLVKACL